MNEIIVSAKSNLLHQLREAYINGHRTALWRACYRLAQGYWTQERAGDALENLAFILRQDALPTELRAMAEELMAEIESRVCPRLVLDARAFAAEMDLQSMVEYLLDDGMS